MDKRLNTLASWLLFELILTVGILAWVMYNLFTSHLPGSAGDTLYSWSMSVGAVLVFRIIFLSPAWRSLVTPDDSTSADKSSEG